MIDFTKLKDLLVEKKCVSSNDYGKEDPFIGIYWEDLLDIVNQCDSTKWISVDETLPEYDECVLAHFEGEDKVGEMFSQRSKPLDNLILDKNGFQVVGFTEVTYWMSIPELKGGK